MKSLVRILLVVVFVLTSSAAMAARKVGPSSAENRAFSQLRGGLNTVWVEVKGLPMGSDLRPALDRTSKDLKYLDGLRKQNDVPSEYVANITALADLMNEATKGEPDAESVEALRDVTEDIQIKAECARKRLSADHDPPPFDPVQVSIRTLGGSGEISNCDVMHVLKGWARDKNRFERFDQLSSPTTSAMPPGKYRFWSVCGGSEGPPLDTPVGREGELSQTIDLHTQ